MRLLAVALFSVVAATAALADDVKKIDFTTPIVIDGVTMVNDFKCPPKSDGKRECETPMTVGELAFWALEKPPPGQTWTDGTGRDDLARAVRNATDFPLLGNQRSWIENAVAALCAQFNLSNAVLSAVAAVIEPKGK